MLCGGRAACVVVLGALACVAGCGGGRNGKVGRVEGTVRLNGQPLTTGKVLFQPAAGRGAMGAIRSDGTFTLGTYGDADGALVGEHKVAVVAYEPGSLGRPEPGTAQKPLKPLVPERYLAAGTSDLTYEVKPGDNHPTLELMSP